MKKILFLVREIEEDCSLFSKAAEQLNIQLDIFTYNDLLVEYNNDEVSILVNGENLPIYDLVHFRNVGDNLETQVLLSEFFLDKGIPIYDPVFRYQKPWIDRKSFEYIRLAQKRLPIIDSVFLAKKELADFKLPFDFPCIAKKTDGKWGEGVFLCKNKQELESHFSSEKKKLVIQKYIANDGDLRVFVIGNKVISTIKRSAAENEFRNNVALGGTTTIFKTNEEIESIALKATQALDYSIAGVDLVFDSESNKWRIMEVNRGPKFAGLMKQTGIDIPTKILKYFLHRKN